MTMTPAGRRLAAAVAAAAVIVVASIYLNAFRDYQIAEIAVDVTAVSGLTVLIGLSGQISIGHGAFMAIGAYTCALLLLHLGWPLVAAFAAAAAVTALAGAVVGLAAARLRGPYLAGATLMLAVALPSLANRYAGALGGDQGLNVNITAPGFLGATFPLTRWQAWVTCAAALVTLVLLANLAGSRVGRNWRAVRDDEVAAALAGLNVARVRILAFVVSSASGGLAGAMLDVTTSHGLSSSVGSNIPVAAYGAVLIVVMLVFPDGIQGGLRKLAAYVSREPGEPLDLTDLSDFRASEHQEEGTT